MVMLSHIVSLCSALLAIAVCNWDHQNAALIRKQKPKKGKADVYKKASSFCTTLSSWLYTVEKTLSGKNGQSLVKKKKSSRWC